MSDELSQGKRAIGVASAITVIGGSLVMGAQPVGAVSFEVINTNDAGAGSLRQAILDANGTAGPDTITFGTGATGTVTLTTGRLGISDELTIIGPGQSNLTVTNPTGDILYIYKSAAVTLSDFSLMGASGRGIHSSGADDLKLTSMTVSGSGTEGIKIDSPGTVFSLNSSTVTLNGGDGVDIDDGTDMGVYVMGSQLERNDDSGIYSDSGVIKKVTITNSMINSNGSTGVYFWSIGGDLTIDDTEMNGNDGQGLRVDDSLGGSFSMTDSEANSNTKNGILLSEAAMEVELKDSSVSGNQAVGVYLKSSLGDVTITGSTLSNNDSHGVYMTSVGGSAEVSDSVFSNNGDTGLYVSDVGGTVVVNAVEAHGNDAGGIKVRTVTGSASVADSSANENPGSGVQVAAVSGVATVEQVQLDANGDGMQVTQNTSEVTITDVSITSSTAIGIRSSSNSGSVALDRVTISESAEQGLSSLGDTNDVSIVNSTLTGNAASPAGSTISSTTGFLKIAHSTITGNGAAGGSAATIAATDTAVTVDHSVVTGNLSSAAAGIGGTGSAAITNSLVPVGAGVGSTNVEADDPELEALADNGGLTMTMLPEIGSPVVDAGDPAIVGAPSEDQRGKAREIGVIDLGAVEVAQDAVSIADASIAEEAGQVEVVVTRMGDAETGATVDVSTVAQSAAAGVDFTPVSTTVSWAAGDLDSKTVIIPIFADELGEGDETFDVMLSNAQLLDITNSSATVTIIDGGKAMTPLAPERFVDTRDTGETLDDQFEADGPIEMAGEYEVQITGRGGVPLGAKAAVMNVTAIRAGGIGFLTIHPCVTPRPVASSLNYTPGVNLGNEVIAPLSANGKVCFFSSAEIEVTVDVVGYVAGDAPVQSLTPARFLDTRSIGDTIDGVSQAAGPTMPGFEIELQVGGRNGVPLDAEAVIVNVTAVGATETGFVTVHPCVEPRPNTASLNHVAGVNRGNELVASLDASGKLCIYTSAAIHLTADVVGYVEAGTSLTTIEPARLLDTRDIGETIDSQFSGDGKRSADTELRLPVTGRAGVPVGAKGAVLNATVVGPEATGFLTLDPCTDPRPNTASLNYVPGINGGNEIVALLNANGEICLYTSSATHLTVDIVGYLV